MKIIYMNELLQLLYEHYEFTTTSMKKDSIVMFIAVNKDKIYDIIERSNNND